MRLSSVFAIAGTFVAAAAISLVAAGFAVTIIEDNSRNSVRNTLDSYGMTWTEVDADGLQVFLAGSAPSEAERFKAISVAGTVVDAARVIDQLTVADAALIAPPRFSVEILRHDSGISLIGLVPATTDREALLRNVAEAAKGAAVADLLEAADYPEPETWNVALDYAVKALGTLPRSKISIDAGRVEITAMADSTEDRLRLEAELARRVPDQVRLALSISAPRPVITPFVLRFLIEDGQARFDTCSADTEAARRTILTAAGKAGFEGRADCTIGLGVPSPQWGKAVAKAIEALGQLGAGSVTFKDADISLVAAQGTDQGLFDDVAGRLDTALPEVFALHAVLPPPPDMSRSETLEFVATLSPEGLVQIRGRVDSALSRDTVDSFAKARFASDSVYTTARIAEGLPRNWPVRILTGLETLSYLSNGAVTVTPDSLTVTGNTGLRDAGTAIAQILSEKLGETEQYSINVKYKEALDPVASVPTAKECQTMLTQTQVGRKIGFEPGSDAIDAAGSLIIDDIAEILRQCGELKMEIGGHTDSQGREVMNQQLSQSRAQAVLAELRKRRVLTSGFSAKGYGESRPIADNKTEEGREANRRIEFRVILPEPVKERTTGLESLEEPVAEEGTLTEIPESTEETPDEQN